MLAALTMVTTAQASSWNFYGSARLETMSVDEDKGSGTSTKNTVWGQQSNARIGAKVAVSDDLKARFEYGTKNGTANLRQLWGEGNFGPGKLLIGQTYTPIYTGYSSSVFDDGAALEGYGTISASRKSMLQLTFGDFKIAAIEPKTDKLTGTSTEVTIPKVEASYTFKFDNMSLKILGGYNSYEVDDTHDIDAYVLGVGAQGSFGPDYLKASAFTGQNLGTYGFKTNVDMDPTITGSSVQDNDNIGYVLVGGYKLNDMFKFEAGYGYIKGELDGSQDDEAAHYYLQSKITLAPGVYLVPEIGKRDEKQDNLGAEQGDTT
ncbi:MAG: hypothetical protein HUK40_02545 [Desulfobacter sp.]|nr:hypothetical protein [Desulfobacter sp.]